MNIFCSGIGGIGLSAYASHMKTQEHTVSGSDKSPSIITEDLKESGIEVSFVQDGSAIPTECDLLVYSEAIPEHSPERTLARKRRIREISYFKALGELSQGKFVISVAGTHGKSSTTAMIAKVLIDAGKDPNVIVGTRMKDMGNKNWRAGRSDLWVIESCEYERSFHYLHPSVVIITNVDGDHFDAYRDLDDYQGAFVEFVKRLPSDGKVIVHGNDHDACNVVKKGGREIINADDKKEVKLQVMGKHMQKNALLALSVAGILGIDENTARASLQHFSGTWRRMDIKGTTKSGALVIDDYGHHPIEIKATLSGIREAYPQKKILCVFQPHTHDRTLKLWDEFASSFSDADDVIIPNVYDARPDRDRKQASVPDLLRAIEKDSHVSGEDGLNLENTLKIIESKKLGSEYIIVTMGAGDITKLSDQLMK